VVKVRSPSGRTRRKPLNLLKRCDGGAHFGGHGIGQRSIVKRRDLLLMRKHPFEEIDDDFTIRGILGRAGNQKPRKTRDGIGVLSRRIGDGNAIIRRHGLETCRGLGHSSDRGKDPVTRSVPNGAIGNLIRQGIDQLDIADRSRGLAYKSGNAFISLGADTCRPSGAVPRPGPAAQSWLTLER
jgi:hypothetical protein